MEPEASWHLGRLGPARAGALAPAGSEFRVFRESQSAAGSPRPWSAEARPVS